MEQCGSVVNVVVVLLTKKMQILLQDVTGLGLDNSFLGRSHEKLRNALSLPSLFWHDYLSALNRHIGHPHAVIFSWDSRGLHGSKYAMGAAPSPLAVQMEM